MPRIVNDVFRPPINCDFCRHVQNIPKLTKLSQEDFEDKFAYSGAPVIVQDATDSWLATSKFSYEFFKNLYSSTSNTRTSRDCQFFPYETEFENLYQVFNMSTERSLLKPGTKPWYIGWSNCQDSAALEMRSLYSRPYFLPKTSGEPTATDWIFMGGPGKGAHLHLDNVNHPSWQAQIRGKKRWTIIPPPECYFQCSGEIIADVYPGEIIVLDTDIWFHQTEILPGDISITIGAEYD
ncbi:uncharacterized protein LOC113385738 [Ctenocephalides felis]|uniref:uncharacterized protein LOC113385738 n=1 Tax=Ctenocephalides felis TaxID=7515 RepID=UPI000E6E1F1E|nr:uncharacterized protein LOC113385738 [Ctenocephalides felis]